MSETQRPRSLAEVRATEQPNPDKWELRLYVAGKTPKSVAALENLRKLCDKASIPLVNSHAVRDMGKFMRACEIADEVIKKVENNAKA